MLSGRSASLLRSAVTPGLGRLLVVVVVVVHFVLLVDAGPQVNRGVSWTIDQDQQGCLPSIGSA
jgi:hypothetical protein